MDCLECSKELVNRKMLGRHVKDVHKILYVDYLKKHGLSENFTCPCGNPFENTRYPGGKRKGGPRQIYCSPKCTRKSVNVKAYGLTLSEYYDILEQQNDLCLICEEPQGEGDRQLAVDHDHVENFFDLPSEEKKQHIRGLLCLVCNHWRVAKNDLKTARNVVKYLEAHQTKK